MALPKHLEGITFKLELITPAKAALILKRNKSNRPLSTENAAFIASAMKRNKFMFTGESVIFGKNGDLMDGQHRLDSVVVTGIEQWFLCVYGVDNNAFKFIDIGKVRSAGDVLSIQNIINPNSMASIARFIIAFNRGQFEKVAGNFSNKRLRISNDDISEFVIKRENTLKESREYGFAKENILLPGNMLSALHFIFKQINYNAACDFCKKLTDGKELEENDPIFILRNELKRDIHNVRKMENLEKVALICKAWNLYGKGKKTNVLKFDPEKEEFPKPEKPTI